MPSLACEQTWVSSWPAPAGVPASRNRTWAPLSSEIGRRSRTSNEGALEPTRISGAEPTIIWEPMGGWVTAFAALQATIGRHQAHAREAEIAAWTGLVGQAAPQSKLADSASAHMQDAGHLVEPLGPAQVLVMVDRCIRSLIDRYESEGPQRLISELHHLRAVAREVGRRTAGVEERALLTRVASEQTALMSYIQANLGRFEAAEKCAFEASWLAADSDKRRTGGVDPRNA